VREVA
jgi:hypothetical protein